MAQKISFTKMHGCGNDYIYVNTMQFSVPNPSEVAVVWSDRHKGTYGHRQVPLAVGYLQ